MNPHTPMSAAPGAANEFSKESILQPRQPLGDPKKVFVIGTGRSGTHWVGHSLGNHPDIVMTIEESPMFQWSVRIAERPSEEAVLLPHLIQRYRDLHNEAMPKHYGDKSHPNIWIAESLARQLPEARFIAMRRGLYATVASMLRHAGTRSRVQDTSNHFSPNRLLGISEDLLEDYRAMSLAARCAVRVIAHAKEIDRLESVLPDRLIPIDYERLYSEHTQIGQALASFLGLRYPVVFQAPRSGSLEQWRRHLSDNEKSDIQAVADRLGAEILLEDYSPVPRRRRLPDLSQSERYT